MSIGVNDLLLSTKAKKYNKNQTKDRDHHLHEISTIIHENFPSWTSRESSIRCTSLIIILLQCILYARDL